MDLRAYIRARPDLDDLRAARNLDGLVAAINSNPPLVRQPRFITGRVIVTLHKTEGRDILTRLEAMAQADIGLRFNMPFLQQGAGLDVGDLAMWENLDEMEVLYAATAGAQGLKPAQVVMLKSLAEQPLMVTIPEVAKALYNDDGSEK